MIFVGPESHADNESIGIGDQLSHLFGVDVAAGSCLTHTPPQAIRLALLKTPF
jgi:hypothetical protein